MATRADEDLAQMRMRWPWISRRAFDMVVDERDRLRTVNDQLTEHLTRMHRNEHGLSETPRVERKPPEKMPENIRSYCMGFAAPDVQRRLLREAKSRHAGGESWPSIWEWIQKDDEPEPT